MSEPILERCELGHLFYKLSDHPKNSMGNARCPYCLSIGIEVLKAEIKALKAKTLTDEEIRTAKDELNVQDDKYSWDFPYMDFARAILKKASGL